MQPHPLAGHPCLSSSHLYKRSPLESFILLTTLTRLAGANVEINASLVTAASPEVYVKGAIGLHRLAMVSFLYGKVAELYSYSNNGAVLHLFPVVLTVNNIQPLPNR